MLDFYALNLYQDYYCLVSRLIWSDLEDSDLPVTIMAYKQEVVDNRKRPLKDVSNDKIRPSG